MDFKLSLQSEPASSAYLDEPLAITPDATVADVLQLLRAQKTAAVLVCEEDKLVGVFTERDALRLMADAQLHSRPVREVMSTDLVTLGQDAKISEAIQRMAEGGYRHLPMVQADGQPVGVVGAPGIVHYLVDHFPETIYNLPPGGSHNSSEREGA